MALKRARWAWGPVLAAVAISVLLLPPGLPPERGLLSALGLSYVPWIYGPKEAHRAALRDAVAVQQRRLREIRLADSIISQARGGRAVRSADGAVTVIYEPPVTADSARVWLRAALGELQLYPGTRARGMPLIVALASNPRRQRDAIGFSATRGTRLSSEATGAPACIVTVDLVVRPLQVRGSALIIRGPSGAPVGRFLDWCALESRFGQPGPAASRMAAWGPNWYWRNDVLTVRLFEARRTVRREDVVRWQYSFWYGEVPWVTLGCLGGATDQCARLAGLGPAGPARGEGYFLGPRMLLASLLADGSAEQFAAFWRSSLPAEEALRSAYARDPGQLVYAAVNHWYSASPADHGAATRVVLAGIFWAGAALALALFAGRRWTTQI